MNLRRVKMTFKWGVNHVTFVLAMILIPWLRILCGAPRESTRSASLRWCRFVCWLFNIRVSIEGLEALENSLPCVVICNHRSWFDQVVLLAAIPAPVRFLAKEGYFKMPVVGQMMKLHGHFCVKKGNREANAEMMTQVKNYLQSSCGIVVIFPEGTRSESDAFLPFQRGAFSLAAEFGCQVVPLYIYGTEKLLRRQEPRWAMRSGEVYLSVGKAFSVRPQDVTREAVASWQVEFEKNYELRKVRCGDDEYQRVPNSFARVPELPR